MRRAMTRSALLCASVLMTVALAGCGGGSGKTAALMPVMVPENSPLEPGPVTIRAGERKTVGEADGVRTVATCPAGGEDCVVTVAEDGSATFTGGEPTVETISYTTITGLPDGHTLTEDTTIRAGMFRVVQKTDDMRTLVTCPADGPDCVVTVGEDGAAQSTGGTPTVETYTTLYLPGDYSLPAGATTIAAGDSWPLVEYSRGRSHDLVCPFDPDAVADCVVILREDGTVESTGGTPYVETTSNEMVWQANNGPDGTSDGAHARGFEGRLLSGGALHGMFTNSAPGWVERAGAIVHSSLHPELTVTPTASWAAGTAPTLGLTVGPFSFPVDGDSSIPSLGEGWNGVALSDPGSTSGHAVIYSNIEKAVGGTPDGYYLTLGAWLAVPRGPAATINYNWGAFANGHAAVALSRSQIIALTGSVTYQGPATGLYSKATYTGSGGSRALQSAQVGSFTATATINYGASRMSGSVTDFRENGESLGDWTVNLDRASLPSGSSIFSDNTNGSADGQTLTGEWGVQPYRNSATSGAELVVGTWTASTLAATNDALHMVGAFGAERQ